jgi:antitoxin component of RelBE/YafQ-DinJ toxin-antitoxin module
MANTLNIRIPAPDKAAYQAAASNVGLSLSSWVRMTLHAAATKN